MNIHLTDIADAQKRSGNAVPSGVIWTLAKAAGPRKRRVALRYNCGT
jgi:hypothetical protein